MSYRQNQDYRDYISQLAWELLSAPPNKLEEVARLSEEDGWMDGSRSYPAVFRQEARYILGREPVCCRANTYRQMTHSHSQLQPVYSR